MAYDLNLAFIGLTGYRGLMVEFGNFSVLFLVEFLSLRLRSAWSGPYYLVFQMLVRCFMQRPF